MRNRHHPDRGPSLYRDDGDSSTRCRSLGMTTNLTTNMNRLKQYLDDEEPLMPEGDYWIIETKTSFLIVSADTLVYFGDLTTVANAAAGALAPGGRLIVTLEHLEDDAAEYRLQWHGRAFRRIREKARGLLSEGGNRSERQGQQRRDGTQRAERHPLSEPGRESLQARDLGRWVSQRSTGNSTQDSVIRESPICR